MSSEVSFQVIRLSELLVTAFKGTDKTFLPGVDAHVCAQIEVQGKAFPTPLESALKRLLSGVNQEMPFQFRALVESCPALCAHVVSGTVDDEMLLHGDLTFKLFCASMLRTSNLPQSIIFFVLKRLCELFRI